MADEIPDGWVSLSSFDKRKENGGGESGEYAALRKAIHEGMVDSMSVGRPKRWYVRRTQAEHYLNAHCRVTRTPVDADVTKRIDDLSSAVRELKLMYDQLRKDLC
jgi:hypothetical protein